MFESFVSYQMKIWTYGLFFNVLSGLSELIRLSIARTGGKPPPSPIYQSLRLFVAPTSEWLFVLGLPRRSPEIVPVWTPATLREHKFQLRPPIVMMSKANLQLLSRAFQRHVTLHLHASELGRFPTFSGRESNCQFDSRPFFLP